MNVKDISNKKFGRLTALEPTSKRKWGYVVWLCKCDCGNVFETTTSDLLRESTVSCGCLRKEKAAITAKKGDNRRKHNMSDTHIYWVWTKIKQRCFNPNDKGYKNYGGRGITICSEWKNDFKSFYDYVSALPHFKEKGYSIDRINNDGNYEPNNIRWATAYQQVHNRRKRNGIKG